jgi:hypothetical protein
MDNDGQEEAWMTTSDAVNSCRLDDVMRDLR